MDECLYRYRDYHYYSHDSYTPIVKIELLRFEIIKETPKGLWIVPFNEYILGIHRNKKWIKKRSRRPFVFRNIRDAKEDFLRRKIGQVAVLKTNLEYAKKALEMAKNDTLEDNLDYRKSMPEMFLTEEDFGI